MPPQLVETITEKVAELRRKAVTGVFLSAVLAGAGFGIGSAIAGAVARRVFGGVAGPAPPQSVPVFKEEKEFLLKGLGLKSAVKLGREEKLALPFDVSQTLQSVGGFRLSASDAALSVRRPELAKQVGIVEFKPLKTVEGEEMISEVR